jgi:hypothetical protein
MTRRACQNKTRRQIQLLIEARLLKRREFLSPFFERHKRWTVNNKSVRAAGCTIKKSPHCAGIYWKFPLPT